MSDTLEQQAQDAILNRIIELTPSSNSESLARAVLNLAEAYAWLERPGMPHGGNSADS